MSLGLRLVLFSVNSDAGLFVGRRPPLSFYLGGIEPEAFAIFPTGRVVEEDLVE